MTAVCSACGAGMPVATTKVVGRLGVGSSEQGGVAVCLRYARGMKTRRTRRSQAHLTSEVNRVGQREG